MAPPDFRAPGGWRLSAGGIPIPPPPTGAALDAAIDEVIEIGVLGSAAFVYMSNSAYLCKITLYFAYII
jgi:hypothetical protein